MAEKTATADALDAVSRVVDPHATEDEIDLTTRPVTWTAPPPEAEPKAAAGSAKPKPTAKGPKGMKVAKPTKRSGTSILAAILGAGAILLVILLGTMTAVLWNRVSDLEDQVDAMPVTATASSTSQSAAGDVDTLDAQVADLRVTADALTAAQAGGATDADIAALTQRLDATIACINTYMDTIANALNTSSPYVYAPC